MQVLVKFKHISVKDYLSGRRHTHNKVIINLQDGSSQEDIEQLADFTVMDIIELLYPNKLGSGYDTCKEYEITSIDTNPYNKRSKQC